jgi:large subunit GTPase 1
MRSGQGNPDESRAARYILKDFVKGKLISVNPPPDFTGTSLEFNESLHSKLKALCKKRPPPPLQYAARRGPAFSVNRPSTGSRNIDSDFFGDQTGRVATKGKFSSGDYSRSSLGRAVTVGGMVKGELDTGKRHKKGKKNQKLRIPVRDE